MPVVAGEASWWSMSEWLSGVAQPSISPNSVRTFFEGRFVGEVGGGLVELVVPLVAGALMLIPPAAPLLLVAAVELVVPGLVPGLRGAAGRGYEAVVEDDAAAGVFGAHGGEDGDGVGVAEVGADLVLEAVLDDGGMRAEGFDHLDALDEHVALREFVGGCRWASPG